MLVESSADYRMFATVVTATRNAGIRSGLTYETNERLQPGMLVRVPFRKKIVEGLVSDVREKLDKETFDVKKIQETLGNTPLLTAAQMKTMAWMADEYMTTLRHLLSIWLPPPPWKMLLRKPVIGYRACEERIVRGKKQMAIVEYLKLHGWVSDRDLRDATKASRQTINALLDTQVIVEEVLSEKPAQHAVLGFAPFVNEPAATPHVHELAGKIARESKPSLLLGGSLRERSVLYVQLIAAQLKAGRQVLLLVPEMLLIDEAVRHLEPFIDKRMISTVKSSLTTKERRTEWKRIERGEVGLVIGTRTALFAPLGNLGLIIIDSEHAWTYKSEQTPRYHARETAETLCKYAKAKLVLASPCPSIESFARTINGRYILHRLDSSVKQIPVRIIDLASVQFGPLYPFSSILIESIETRMRRREQSLLLLNRRGQASALLCLECRRRIVSSASNLPYTVHLDPRGNSFLFDHTTGERAELPARCPHCGSIKLQNIGTGTQRIEDMLQRIFPRVRVLRADRESLEKSGALTSMIGKMRRGEADILLGTQSIVKGIDLPNVTLAAALLADVGLCVPDFRAGERVWQILSELAECCAPVHHSEVLIQTFRPDALEIETIKTGKAEEYLEGELKLRTFAEYPPATRMIRLLFNGDNAERDSHVTLQKLNKAVQEKQLTFRVTRAPRLEERGKTWQILLRGRDPRGLLEGMNLEKAVIDIDPMETA